MLFLRWLKKKQTCALSGVKQDRKKESVSQNSLFYVTDVNKLWKNAWDTDGGFGFNYVNLWGKGSSKSDVMQEHVTAKWEL